MPIPDPDANMEFIALAERLRSGELDKRAFDAACKQMLIRHGLLLPEPGDCEPDRKHEPDMSY